MSTMNRLLENQVDNSVFTLGDEADDESLGQEPQAPTISAADIRLSEGSKWSKGESAGSALHNGLTQANSEEPGKGMETPKPNDAEKQRSAHPTSPGEIPVVEEYSGLNGRSEAAPTETNKGVPQLNGQAGAAPSSGRPVAESLAVTVETTNGADEKKPAPPPIPQQLSGAAANSREEPGALEHNSQSDSQNSAAVNHKSPEPRNAQAVSPEAEEQRIADELAALEAEAEALALQKQQHKTASHSAGMDLSRYSVSLADESRSADRAMAEAQQVPEQASSGATAMQSALDSFEPRARPFSPPPGSAPLQRFSPIGEFVEPPELQGLLYSDGLDTLARPVVVINADAVAEEKGARKAAIQYLLHQLEPVVSQGPYVLVMVNTGRGHKSNRLQASWLVSAYRGLSRPFRKNVKYIILVRPSKALKAFLTMLRPFLSRKAHRKVVKVESLSGIAEATGNEVTLQHLGARFAAAAGRSVSDDLSLTSPTLRGASSPTFSSSPH